MRFLSRQKRRDGMTKGVTRPILEPTLSSKIMRFLSRQKRRDGMTKGVTRPILEPTYILKNNEIRLSSIKTRRKDLFARIINTRKRENLCAPCLQVYPSTNLSFPTIGGITKTLEEKCYVASIQRGNQD